jgi:alkylmercury lyase
MASSAQLDEWAKAVVDASPSTDAEDRRIIIETYRLLAGGEPISETQVAAAAGFTLERVQESLRAWPLVLRTDEDLIVGFWGMHADHVEPTHAMTHDASTVFGWCALDTLFIPEIIDREVRVESTDPTTGTRVRLTVTPEGIADLEPPEAVVSLLLPRDTESFDDNAIARFCHQIYFFDSPRSAEAWIGSRQGRFFLPVAEAFELGKKINRLRLGEIDEIVAGRQTS